ncbi:ABC transporter substrate-binding protein [Sphingobacterium sp.]|uniref:ABC transporter substrate-binding protein n=1 Tax=Sphingobacterium sp. TaxID=341027 RepID=UPI0028B0B0AA|nr:ABC transporter substrate-binding protein [Sphingobacterium sp.]
MKNSIKIITSLLGIMLIFLTVSCNSPQNKEKEEGQSAIMVEDALGAKINLDKPVKRIVCLDEPGLDALFVLGAEKSLVGIFNDVYMSQELYPYYSKMSVDIAERKIPAPGLNNQGNIENIIELSPDLVIAASTQNDLIETLRNAGIQVYALNAISEGEVYKTVEDIGMLTGKEDRAKEIVSFTKSEVKRMQQEAVGVNEKRRVYFTGAYGRIFSTTGTNGMMHSCLTMAAVENVCPYEVGFPTINPETLIEWNPDMIVMWNDSPNLFYDRKEFAGITAIKNKQIFNLDPMFFYNPHTLKALCTASLINEWAYQGDSAQTTQRITEVLQKLYGNEKSERLVELL